MYTCILSQNGLYYSGKGGFAMILKVLAVGDVVGNPGLERIARSLRYLKRQTGADLVIVNGENAS